MFRSGTASRFERARLVLLALALACSTPTALAEDGLGERPEVLSAVVGVYARVPETARTADALGTERDGSGIVIDAGGLVVTIGYLILEANSVEIDANGRIVSVPINNIESSAGGSVRCMLAEVHLPREGKQQQ